MYVHMGSYSIGYNIFLCMRSKVCWTVPPASKGYGIEQTEIRQIKRKRYGKYFEQAIFRKSSDCDLFT